MLVKNPDTFTTPESMPVATFSDIFVIFLTLYQLLHYRFSSDLGEESERRTKETER